MIKFFKTIATLEGISFLALLFIGVPLKYTMEMEQVVKIMGPIHGFLFIAYIVLAIMLNSEQKWPTKKFVIICLASVVPFGTFYIENKYFKESANS